MFGLLTSSRRLAQPAHHLRLGGSRAFGNRQNFPPSTYAGPYTPDEVHQLEKYAVELKQEHVDQKLVNPWLRAKLGPYFRDGWTDRVAERAITAERAARHEAQRPADSTHFTVKHAAAAAASAEEAGEAGAPQVFAVVGLAGTQFKVVEGDVIVCNRIPQAVVGTRIELTDVLMVGSKGQTHIGRPNVPGWVVQADVEQQAREKKRLSFYKQPKTFSQKMRGFRREVTILRIGPISQVQQQQVLGEEKEKEDNK